MIKFASISLLFAVFTCFPIVITFDFVEVRFCIFDHLKSRFDSRLIREYGNSASQGCANFTDCRHRLKV
ncbi:hypothetical protein L1887_14746 [Cichorium endivia]|nr:hypothetical protein L1887_14746 [Cichorium endivia]